MYHGQKICNSRCYKLSFINGKKVFNTIINNFRKIVNLTPTFRIQDQSNIIVIKTGINCVLNLKGQVISERNFGVFKSLKKWTFFVRVSALASKMALMLGRWLRGNDKKTVRKEGIEPIKRVSTYVLFSVKSFL